MHRMFKNIALLVFLGVIAGCASDGSKIHTKTNINAVSGSEREVYGSIQMGGAYNL